MPCTPRTVLAHTLELRMTRAHVVTGSFGSGKTTAIRWLMSRKPETELWVVVLNEFTDAGLDVISVAQSARGAHDVRLVAGGCLCCVGELEFGKQIRDILRRLKPHRLLIEPSGAGHASEIVDELERYAAQGALHLDSIVCLVDPQDAVHLAAVRAAGGGSSAADAMWSQIQCADVLLLSKPDLADATAQRCFESLALEQFPAKRYVGRCARGELPPEALQRYERDAGLSLLRPPALSSTPVTRDLSIAGTTGSETQLAALGLVAVSWILPGELQFARSVIEPRLAWLLEAHSAWIRRFKAVLRTGPGPSWQLQSAGRGLTQEDSAYRRDSRLELVLAAAPDDRFLEAWRALLRDAAQRRPSAGP